MCRQRILSKIDPTCSIPNYPSHRQWQSCTVKGNRHGWPFADLIRARTTRLDIPPFQPCPGSNCVISPLIIILVFVEPYRWNAGSTAEIAGLGRCLNVYWLVSWFVRNCRGDSDSDLVSFRSSRTELRSSAKVETLGFCLLFLEIILMLQQFLSLKSLNIAPLLGSRLDGNQCLTLSS